MWRRTRRPFVQCGAWNLGAYLAGSGSRAVAGFFCVVGKFRLSFEMERLAQTVETFIQDRGAIYSPKQDPFDRNDTENTDPNRSADESSFSRGRRTPSIRVRTPSRRSVIGVGSPLRIHMNRIKFGISIGLFISLMFSIFSQVGEHRVYVIRASMLSRFQCALTEVETCILFQLWNQETSSCCHHRLRKRFKIKRNLF